VRDFARDLTGGEYAVELKGRGNYPCLRHPDRFPYVSAALCTHKRNPCEHFQSCPYRLQKHKLLRAELGVINTPLLLTEANYAGQLSGWSQLVIDEADELEANIMGFVALEITATWIARLGLEPPEKKTVPETWIPWARDLALPKAEMELARLQADYGVENLRREHELERMVAKLKFFLREIEATKWVFQAEETRWTFRPVYVDRYAPGVLWRHAERFLLMSATIISPDEMAHTLGIPRSDIEFIDLPSTFPPERRPVYFTPTANMTHQEARSETPKMIEAIDHVLDQHPHEKTLVHTVSYSLARQITGSSRHRGRMLSYDSARAREATLMTFKTSENGTVLVASSMARGVDLPDDECRVVIIAKVPFANLGDKQVSARLYGGGKAGKLWYVVNTIRAIVQASGRGMRSAEDQCATHILDAQFGRLYRDHKHLFPNWWREALKMQPALPGNSAATRR
jgi:Rad3-related DNA helicase